MSIFLSYLLVFQVFAQGPSEAEFVASPEPQPSPSFLTLLDSQAYPCEKEESKTECERNLIYEKDTESIIQLVSDGRSLKSGGLDVNQVLRSPASYGGDIKTIKLSSIFSGQAQFDSVIARYNKDGKLVVEVVFAGKKNKVIMDAPSPY